jgi:hypothetical protein
MRETDETVRKFSPSSLFTCLESMDPNETIVWRGKKRGRDAEGKTSRILNYSGCHIAASLFVLLVLLPGAVAKSFFYNSCFEHIRKADDNGDLLLSREEYSKLLITISGGAILLQNETPPVLSDPYANRLQAGSQAVSIKGIQITSVFTTIAEIGLVESFCKDIYAGLVSIFDIKISAEQCAAAFQSADLHPPNENLSPDEYSFFVVSLTNDISLLNSNFTELTNTIQGVFNDMSVDDEVPLQQGPDYLLEFCQRVAIAVEIGELVNASMPTVSPSIPPPTEVPVSHPITIQPTANLPPEYTPCKTALIACDLNKNLWLDFSEYGPLVELLSNKRVASATFGSLDSIFQDTYSGFLSTGDSLSLAALKSGSNSKPSEIQNLIQICKKTTEAIAFFETEYDAPYTPSRSPSVKPSESASDSLYQDCKSSMILSDLNRNKALDEAEYVQFVTKMAVNTDLLILSFDDLDAALQNIFITASSTSTGGISISGFSPGQEPTAKDELYFRNICMEVHDAIVNVDTTGPKSLPPSDQYSPSESPSSHTVQVSDQLFRVCVFAIDIADEDRDDVLDKVEYMRFLNRLTISEFSGLEFSDIEPVLQSGFNEVAVDGKIDVYGTKPGVSRTESEENHLQEVCEAAFTAIEDYHSGKTFEPPVNATRDKCVLSLFDADMDHSSRLNESEYLAFLKSFGGMNATKSQDTLPFLLKESFNLFSLGKDTINIYGSTDSTSTLSGDALRVKWICTRIEGILDIVSKIPHNSTFTDFCNVTIGVSDQDNDGYLSEDEYSSLILLFSAGSKTDVDFESLDDVFRRGYNKLKSVRSGLVDIEESKSDELCEMIQEGTIANQPCDTFVQLCSMAANMSDLDSNGNLNKTEYGPLVKYLLNAYNMTNSSLRYFEALNVTDKETPLKELLAGDPVDRAENYLKLCESLEYSFGITNSSMTSISIQNSFYIANSGGISASSLTPESEERRALDKAYTLFVENQVLELSDFRIRNLALQSNSLSNPEINQILDVTCPISSQNEQNCQKLIASFNITLSGNDDASSVMNFYGNKTRIALESGALQRILTTIDPYSSLTVMNYTELLQPALDMKEPPKGESSVDGKASFSWFVVLGVAIGASFFGASLFYFLTSTRRKFVTTAKHDAIAVDELKEDPKNHYAFHLPIDGKSEDVELGKASNAPGFFISSYHDDDCTAGISETTCSPGTNQVFGSDFVVNDESESESEYRSTGNIDSRDVLVTSSHFYEEVETMSSNAFSPIAFDDTLDAPSEASCPGKAKDVSVSDNGIWGKQNCGKFDDEWESSIEEKDRHRVVGERIESSEIHDSHMEKMAHCAIRKAIMESHDSTKGGQVPLDSDCESLDAKSIRENSEESLMLGSDGEDMEEVTIGTCSDSIALVNGIEIEGSVLTDDLGMSTIANKSVSDESETVRSESEEEDERKMNTGVESIRVTSVHDEDDEKSQVSCSDSSDDAHSATESDEGSSVSQSESNESEEDESSFADEDLDSNVREESFSSLGEDNTSMNSAASLDSACIRESYEKYRPIIEDLVRRVMPGEIDNIDAMMEQFIGKEHELVETLKNMAVSEENDESSMDGSSAICESDDEEEDENDSVESEADTSDGDYESGGGESSSIDASEEDENSDEDDDVDIEESSDVEESSDGAVEESEYSEETVKEDELDENCKENDDSSDEVESSEYESD